MNHHKPKLRRANGLLTTRGVPVAALNDRNENGHDHPNHLDHHHPPHKSNMAINPTAAIGLGAAPNGNNNNNNNNGHKTNGNVNNSTPPHTRKRPRPSSLTLTVAGEWLQRGVKSLGGGLGITVGPWSTTNKRQSFPIVPKYLDPPRLPVHMPTLAKSMPPAGEDGPQQQAAAAASPQQVPEALQEGTWMTKVSGKNQKKVFLRLDPDIGHIIWHSKQPRIIPIENIKEIRSGPSTRLHRHHFQLAQEYETLWLTIIYILDGHYKILHLIAPSEDIFRMWDTTLRRLHAHRLQLMIGLGNIEERQRVWEKQYWKGADVQRDQRLTFEKVEKMCRRLNINSPREDLSNWFRQADVQNRNYLDFEDFRHFVKLLKTRREITKIFNNLKGNSEYFDFDVFARFMCHDQKSTLELPALQVLFEKYSVPITPSSSTSPPPTPHPAKEVQSYFPPTDPVSQKRTFTPETFTTFLLSPDNAPFAPPLHSSVPPKSTDGSFPLSPPPPVTATTPSSSTTATITSSLPSTKHDMTYPLSSYYISSSHNTYLVGHQLVGSSTVEGYIRALLGGCRSVEIDIYDGSGSSDSMPIPVVPVAASSSSTTTGEDGVVPSTSTPGTSVAATATTTMTCSSTTTSTGDRPSSSSGTTAPPPPTATATTGTNTTMNEPMVFHGHTLTTKVPLRQICQAIMKYGFIASPYPIIISAENHCSVQGQEMIARIMVEEFGSALVRYPIDGVDLDGVDCSCGGGSGSAGSGVDCSCSGGDQLQHEKRNWKGKRKIAQLPSPEELKGRILLKTKNLMLGKSDATATISGVGVVTSSESEMDPSSSASESEIGLSRGLSKRGFYRQESDGSINGKKKKSGEGSDLVREGLIKATNMLQRVRSVGRSSNLSTLPTPTSQPKPQQQQSFTPSQTTLASSPPSFPPPLPPLSTVTTSTTLPKPIPIPRTNSSTSVPPSSFTQTSLPASYPSISSGSSPRPKSTSLPIDISSPGSTTGMTTPLPGAAGGPSSYTGQSLLLSPTIGSSTTTNTGGGALALVRRKSSQRKNPMLATSAPKPKMSMALLALLVYTVGVKCRGFRRSGHLYLQSDGNGSVSDSKKSAKYSKGKDGGGGGEVAGAGVANAEDEELYAPEHMFSLSENSANKMLRVCMLDLIRHTEGHLVRVYPRGTRMRSTNFEPHRYWGAGAQLVAINWQTFDLGYIINHAMFQRNARCGYVLKPPPLRHPSNPEFGPEKWRKKGRVLNVTVISAQQLPRVKIKDGSGHEVLGLDRDKDGSEEGKDVKGSSVDPYVEVSLHIPEWTHCISPVLPLSLPSVHATTHTSQSNPPSSPKTQSQDPLRFATSQPKTLTHRTQIVKNNGFNPIWNEVIRIPFDCIPLPGMLELIFVRFVVKQEGLRDDAEPLAVCCVSLGEMQQGYRHLPLYDATLSQYLFSTLFVKIAVS